MKKIYQPLVSIIIPTYKRPGMLGRAIKSVLNQTYKNIEIIVVDDNDEGTNYRKETAKFMNKYIKINNINYLKHKKNKNGATARNTGIKYAKGEYISFLDDDDVYLPKKIELQVELIRELDNSWGGVYSGFRIKKNSEVTDYFPNKEGNLKKELLLKEFDFGTGSNLFIKKSIIKKLNGFDTSFIRHQDWEFLIRFFRSWKLGYVNKVLVIKYQDDFINFPKLDNWVETKKQFLNKFSKDINCYNIYIQNEIYKRHWYQIARFYVQNKKLNEGIFYLKKANSFTKIKFNSYFKIIIDFLDSFFNIKKLSLYKILKKILKL